LNAQGGVGMFRLGSKVIIVQDSIEQNLPIHEYGYIIAYEKNPDNVFDYVIRVPKLNKNVAVAEIDIQLEKDLFEKEAERIQREALIDFALATNNRMLFDSIMNGDAACDEAMKQVEAEIQEQLFIQLQQDGTIRREVH
jgi:hypothetical protein